MGSILRPPHMARKLLGTRGSGELAVVVSRPITFDPRKDPKASRAYVFSAATHGR